jgi:beta-mannosidase
MTSTALLDNHAVIFNLISFSSPVDSNLVNQPGVFLVLHGVDTIAEISLNGLFLGETDNMFVRYRFNVRNLLKVSR